MGFIIMAIVARKPHCEINVQHLKSSIKLTVLLTPEAPLLPYLL